MLEMKLACSELLKILSTRLSFELQGEKMYIYHFFSAYRLTANIKCIHQIGIQIA